MPCRLIRAFHVNCPRQQLYKLQQTFVVLPDYPMVNSSTSMILSCENVTFDPLESRTSLTPISLRLPMAVNFTFTGKKAPGSEGGAPETLNSSEADVSEDDIRGTVQTSEWSVRLYDWESELTFAREFGLYIGDRQPVREERGSVETYGMGTSMLKSYIETSSFSNSYSIVISHFPSLEGVGQQLIASGKYPSSFFPGTLHLNNPSG